MATGRSEESRRSDLRASLHRRVLQAQQGNPSGVIGSEGPSEVGALLASPPADDAELAEDLNLLAWFTISRFEALAGDDSAIGDLYYAVVFTRRLQELDVEVSSALAEAVDRAHAANAAAVMQAHAWECLRIYQALRDLEALTRAIETFDVAASLSEDSAVRWDLELVLSSSLSTRFELTGARADSDRAVSLARAVIAQGDLDDQRMLGARTILSGVLQQRFERLGELEDLDDAVTIAREAVDSITPEHPLFASCSSGLANALTLRFDQLGDVEDIEDAVAAGELAVKALNEDSRDQLAVLSNLSNALHSRFHLRGGSEDLDRAIELDRRVVEALPSGHPDLAKYRSNLGLSLRSRYHRSAEPLDLDEAVAQSRAAVEATPAGDPRRGRHLSNLAAAVQSRYDQTADRADLEEAIFAGREAVAATDPDDPNRLLRLVNLSGALYIQFRQTGGIVELNQAIEVARESLRLCSPGHPDLGSYRFNLSLKLLARAEHEEGGGDLDEAVSLARDAIATLPAGHPSHPPYLSNLGAVLMERYRQVGRQPDLAAAVEAFAAAVELSPALGAPRSRYLQNLVSARLAQIEQSPSLPGLDELIALQEEAVRALSSDHPSRARRLLSLGQAVFARYKLSGDRRDLDRAAEEFSTAAHQQVGSPEARIDAAASWANVAILAGDSEGAADGYELAVRLLPLRVWHGLPLVTREKHLADYNGLVASAAAQAIAAGRLERAVELLEAGRAVVWAQVLGLRTDLTELGTAAPELADELRQVRAALEATIPTDLAGIEPSGNTGPPISATEPAAERMRLAGRFDELVARVRELDGFQTFLEPTPLAELLEAARGGPVALVNGSPLRCDVLLLRRDGVELIPLPGISHAELGERVLGLLRVQAAARRSDRSAEERQRDQQFLRDLLAWIWDEVASPVVAAVADRETDLPDGLSRLWWCPAGLFSLLPLHAAEAATGRRGEGESVLDCVVSSYTPTLSALIRAGARPPSPRQTLLAVGLPTTSGQPDLPAVPAELDAVESWLPITTRMQTPIPGRAEIGGGAEAEPTVEDVLRELKRHTAVHFACHGTQDVFNPAASSFWLSDGPLTVGRLMSGSDSDSDKDLAVLSACNTAAGSVRTPDESLNLASAMGFAGYRHVIATLWSTHDALAPVFADRVYAELAVPSGMAVDRAALAVRKAVLKLRDAHPSDPFAWAPYIHVGP